MRKIICTFFVFFSLNSLAKNVEIFMHNEKSELDKVILDLESVVDNEKLDANKVISNNSLDKETIKLVYILEKLSEEEIKKLSKSLELK